MTGGSVSRPRTGRPTPDELRELARRDPALGAALERVPAFPGFPVGVLREGSHFHSLARSVIYQQIAGAAARAIYARVRALGSGGRFPTPAEILALPEERLRAAGLSRNKLRCIRDLAARVESGELRLRGVGRLPDEAVVERLTTVWGVGVWSAQMFLLFRLGRLDVMPATDLGIQEGIRRLDALEARPGPTAVLERSEPWKPLRSVASWVLWRLCDVETP